jgi:hypothetical protein
VLFWTEQDVWTRCAKSFATTKKLGAYSQVRLKVTVQKTFNTVLCKKLYAKAESIFIPTFHDTGYVRKYEQIQVVSV